MRDHFGGYEGQHPSNRRTARHNLPAQLTTLVGREREVAAACTLLQQLDVRLVTLTGTGGVGKTRLGLRVATELLNEFAEGVYFVSLAPISDPDLVVPTIAQTLGIKEVAGRTFLDLLKAYLRDKYLLLLLDNFEQVMTAAPRLSDLLADCPPLKLLVTSRAVLHVRGEHEFCVPPLVLPDLNQLPGPEALARVAAVALFLQRARAVRLDFQITEANARTIAAICTRLDGLPLALELAAARIKFLSPPALLARLEKRLQVLTQGPRDVHERQQTLRNTIAWSYQLLEADEQRLFRRLSVFAGGCTLEAIEAVCAALDGAAGQVLDTVASLVDSSLVHQTEQQDGERRLGMLETIREFGWESLSAHQEMEPTRAAHAAYYLRLAEEADVWLWGPQLLSWLERLEREHENLRAALSWSLEQGPAEEAGHRKEMALRLGGALHRFWFSHGHFSEGRTFLERALAASAGVATASRAKALNAAADLASNLVRSLEDIERGETLAEEALVLYRAVGDGAGIGRALGWLGRLAWYRHEYARARSLLEESVVLLKELGNQWQLGWSLFMLAYLEDRVQGEHVKAHAHFEEALALYRELGDKEAVATVLVSFGRLLHYSQGDLVIARAMIDEALMLSREVGSKLTVALSLSHLAEITLSQGDLAAARELSEEALALWRELGARQDMALPLAVLARVEARLGDYDRVRHLYEDLLTLAREIVDKSTLPFYLEGLAEVVAVQGELVWSARLWGAAESLRDAIASPLPSFYRTGYERAVAAARTQLGEQAFDAAWAEGRSMTLEQVLAAPGRAEVSMPAPAGPPAAITAKPSPTYPAGLTAREVEVLRLVAKGLTNGQIAEQLIISPRTVNTHLISIFGKIRVSTRSAATRYAIEQHVV